MLVKSENQNNENQVNISMYYQLRVHMTFYFNQPEYVYWLAFIYSSLYYVYGCVYMSIPVYLACLDTTNDET